MGGGKSKELWKILEILLHTQFGISEESIYFDEHKYLEEYVILLIFVYSKSIILNNLFIINFKFLGWEKSF